MAPSIRVGDSGNLGSFMAGALTVQGKQRLSGDSVGTFTFTLQNLVIGSLWEIEVASVSGASVQSGIAAGPSVVISLNVYQSGSANNNLRIKVRNASAAPYYQAFETQVTAFSGASSIFINQVRDDI